MLDICVPPAIQSKQEIKVLRNKQTHKPNQTKQKPYQTGEMAQRLSTVRALGKDLG